MPTWTETRRDRFDNPRQSLAIFGASAPTLSLSTDTALGLGDLVPRRAVDLLAKDVGVAAVPGKLSDHVHVDVAH